MNTLQDHLASLEYPGRFIMLGKSPDGKNDIAVYGITGRSAPSQARKLTYTPNESNSGGIVSVGFTDSVKVEEMPRPDLLLYNAAIFNRTGIVVGNGKQTSSVQASWPEVSINRPCSNILEAHSHFDCEDDPPNFTPRISGFLRRNDGTFGLIKRGAEGHSKRSYFHFSTTPGLLHFISTYAGKNENPLQPFAVDPVELVFDEGTPDELANKVYDSLAPKPGAPDFRVAVAVISHLHNGTYQNFVVNRSDLEGRK